MADNLAVPGNAQAVTNKAFGPPLEHKVTPMSVTTLDYSPDLGYDSAGGGAPSPAPAQGQLPDLPTQLAGLTGQVAAHDDRLAGHDADIAAIKSQLLGGESMAQ